MRTSRYTALGVTAILSVAAALAVSADAAPSDPHHSDGTETINFSVPWNGGHNKTLDLGKKGVTPGDEFLVTGVPLYDTQTGKRIGAMDGTETIVSLAHHGTVEQPSTLRLHDGLVMVDGIVRHTNDPLRIAVVGGTGRYYDVRGQLTVLREDSKTKRVIMRLDLEH